MLIKCTCDHDYQDLQYGYRMRVHNPIVTKSGDKKYRCTVCEKERSA